MSIELEATIGSLGKSSWGLIFRAATYEINFEEKYNVSFSLEGYKCDAVEIKFSI